jgi:hypothetical protein
MSKFFAGTIEDVFKDTNAFNDCWRLLGAGFEVLTSFVGGIATAVPCIWSTSQNS